MKNLRLVITLYFFVFLSMSAASLSYAAPPGSSNARPNVSDGFDYYDSSGRKTGSSSMRADGGYDYYDSYGNPIGRLEKDETSGSFKYHDLNNITSGSLDQNSYGGFTFTDKDTSVITAEQSQIRRNYDYANPYGSGIDTFSPDTLRGVQENQTDTETGSDNTSGFELSAAANDDLTFSGADKSGLEPTYTDNTGLDFSSSVSSNSGLQTD